MYIKLYLKMQGPLKCKISKDGIKRNLPVNGPWLLVIC